MAVARSYRYPVLLGLLLIFGGIGLGCNVFDGLQSNPRGVEALLGDADVAMNKGEPQRAVQLLERAFEKDSTHVGIRVELVNALYAARGVDLVSVRAAIEQVNGTDATKEAVDGADANCSGAEEPSNNPASLSPVPIHDETALGQLATHADLFRRASQLLVDGVLRRRADALGAIPTSRRLKAYLLASLTRMGERLWAVREVLQETEGTLYAAGGGASQTSAIVACGDTRGAREEVESALCRLKEGTGQAVSWLRTRNALASSEQASLLISLLASHGAALRTGPNCKAATQFPLTTLRPQHRSVE